MTKNNNNNNVTFTIREHEVYKQWISAGIVLSAKPIVGRWQHIAESPRGKISIVELPNYFLDDQTLWEIYCIEGSLFEDIERFHTLDDAKKRAIKYLGVKKKEKEPKPK